MKAVILKSPGGLDQLHIADMTLARSPGPDEVAVELHASSLNYHDYLVVTGAIPTSDGLVPMTDGAGVVTEVGENVHDLAPGDMVMSNFFPNWEDGLPGQDKVNLIPGDTAHGYAREACVMPRRAFSKAPKTFSAAEAATLPCAGLTAWRALVVEGRIKAGESVIVQGTGGVSLFALQIAKASGARVIATSSSNEKLERLKAMGADETINYSKHPEWGDMAREMAGGDGADHIVEVGGAGTLPQSLKAVKNGGHISLIGVLAGFRGDVPIAEVMIRQIRLIGITVGSGRMLRDFVSMIETNKLHPVIDRKFSLEQTADAFRYQESGRHFGKIVTEW